MMDEISEKFPYLARYAHEVSHDANTAVYKPADFAKQWHAILKQMHQDTNLSVESENLSVDDLCYESSKEKCEKIVQEYLKVDNLDLNTITVPDSIQMSPLASMVLTEQIRRGEKKYFAKNRNYLL